MNRVSGGFGNPVLIGASIVVALIVGVFLSYNANKGLPFVKTYDLSAELPDAAELVTGSEVRIGGFRVGQVVKITAEPAEGDKPPFAKVDMKLDGTIAGIPADTLVRVRPRSLLGAKFVELEPGDRDDLDSGSTLPLGNARKTVELDEAFNVFDADTRKGLQDTLRGLGDALAGRGGDLNRSIEALQRLQEPLQHVSTTLAKPDTGLANFIEGLGRTMGALAPVSDDLGDLLRNASTTFAAINAEGDAFEQGLAELPSTLREGIVALRSISPVTRDLADITVALERGTRRLPQTADALNRGLVAATRTLPRTPELTEPLEGTIEALKEIAEDARAPRATQRLVATVKLLQPTLTDLEAAQVNCNVGGTWARNVSGAVSRGDAQASWLAFVPIIRTEQSQRAAEPDPDLHVSTVPTLDSTECESGNETYVPGRQVIGNAPGTQPAFTEETAPPADSYARARAAGLLDAIPGASR